jgi:hypothetical protein
VLKKYKAKLQAQKTVGITFVQLKAAHKILVKLTQGKPCILDVNYLFLA